MTRKSTEKSLYDKIIGLARAWHLVRGKMKVSWSNDDRKGSISVGSIGGDIN
jgi:hypothetical protein